MSSQIRNTWKRTYLENVGSASFSGGLNDAVFSSNESSTSLGSSQNWFLPLLSRGLYGPHKMYAVAPHRELALLHVQRWKDDGAHVLAAHHHAHTMDARFVIHSRDDDRLQGLPFGPLDFQ